MTIRGALFRSFSPFNDRVIVGVAAGAILVIHVHNESYTSYFGSVARISLSSNKTERGKSEVENSLNSYISIFIALNDLLVTLNATLNLRMILSQNLAIIPLK